MKLVREQKDIAPTLAKILGLSYNVPSGKSIGVEEEFIGEKVLLAIVDSLDWLIYTKFGRPILENICVGSLHEFKVSSTVDKTSPSIATVLTGLDPGEHKIFSTEDARHSGILNLPEFVERNGLRSTVIMEEGGANTFLKSLNQVTAVKDTGDVDAFDRKILSGVSRATDRFEFIVCHLRTIDEYLHQVRSLEEIRESLEKILNIVVEIARTGNFLLVITGDHKAHGKAFEGSEILPLVFLDI